MIRTAREASVSGILDRLFSDIWTAVSSVAPSTEGIVVAGSAARGEITGTSIFGKLQSDSDIEFVVVSKHPWLWAHAAADRALDKLEGQYFVMRQKGRFNYWVVSPRRFLSDRALFFVEARANNVRYGRAEFVREKADALMPRRSDLREVLLHRLVHAYRAICHTETHGVLETGTLGRAIGRDLLDLLTVYCHHHGLPLFSYEDRAGFFEKAEVREQHPFVTETLIAQVRQVMVERVGGVDAPDGAIVRQRLQLLLDGTEQLLREMRDVDNGDDGVRRVDMNDAGWKTIVHRVSGIANLGAWRAWRTLFIRKNQLYLALRYRLKTVLAGAEHETWRRRLGLEIERVFPGVAREHWDACLSLWIQILYPYVRRSACERS